MGTFVSIPWFYKNSTILNSFIRESTTDLQSDAEPTLPPQEDYRISISNTPKVKPSRWERIKHRKKYNLLTNRIHTTRYNILTFLPKNLFEQFHRIANIYFALVIILNWIPIINAISRTVAFIPLAVILVITGVKDLVEDFKRWRSDVHINNQVAEIYDKESRQFTECKWRDLSVGDVVRVRVDQAVPADILLLSSTSRDTTCYLDTAAIDGETNLKQRSVPPCFVDLARPEELEFELQCDPPNEDIYHFYGRIVLSPNAGMQSCDSNNILLRGCVLRITESIVGIIVYAGNQAKIIKSSRKTSSKHSRIERHINRDVLFSSVILSFLCLLAAGLSIRWQHSFGDQWRYITFILDDPFSNSAGDFFASAVRFVILFQVMIPIALYVSLDIVRVLQIYRISKDRRLKHDHSINCRTFTINEDLGQIGYILSDKTGTLTQNQLIFKEVSIGGIRYSNRSQLPVERDLLIHHFLTALAICNTSFIVYERHDLIHRMDYEPKYEGDNADDLVLCQAASNFGVRMVSRTAQTVVVRYISADDAHKEDVEYEILCLLPFDSSRKRMSIVVRANDRIYLYIKGADSLIWPHLSNSNDWDLRAITEQHMTEFAEQGYRSLLVAYREISAGDFQVWFRRYQAAVNSLNYRDEAIAAAATEIEVDLLLAGLTAVEDRLQEGVPKAIEKLRCAGIKIWLLTGDKQATALSTAQAASLVNMSQTIPLNRDITVQDDTVLSVKWNASGNVQLKLNQFTQMIYYKTQLSEISLQMDPRDQDTSDDEITIKTVFQLSEVISSQTYPVCLVVTGEELDSILQYAAKTFISAAGQCQSVIFCRVSATQKRELVKLAKSVFKDRILAIGDGANDVGMIRQAHCGVAVYGREGSQAAAAGDFVVDRFECLIRLLLVHGAWCFTRTSELILFTFMHNCQYIFVLFYDQIYNGFSGITSIHSLYLVLYTSLFTVLPQCATALFDEHISEERALSEPHLYQYTLRGKSYRAVTYWLNFLDAVWQATIIYFFTYHSYVHQSDIDRLSLGFSLVFSMVVTSLIHVLIQTRRIDWSLISSTIFSFLAFFIFTLIFDATCVMCLPAESPYDVCYKTMRQARFWFTNLFVIITAMLPRFAYKCIYNTTRAPFG